MTRRRNRLAAVLLASLLVVGCGPQPDGPAVPARAFALADPAAPRALLHQWHTSLVGGDKQTYLACFAGSQDELVLVLAVFDAVQAGYEFHRAVTAAYGPKGWQAFESPQGSTVALFPREETWVAALTVVRTGTSSVVYLPRGRVPMHLFEADGRWYVHAASLVPPGFDAHRSASHLFRWAATLRALIPQMTGGQVTAERARTGVTEDYKARLSPAEQPEAAAAVDAFLLH